MPDDAPLPPPRSRWRTPIVLALLGMLAIAVGAWRYRQQVAQEVGWSRFLERIRAGEVVEIQLGPTYAVVREGTGSPNPTYQVRYPAGVLGDAERRTISDLSEERERQARRDELAGLSHPAVPISISGLPGARPWWRFW